MPNMFYTSKPRHKVYKKPIQKDGHLVHETISCKGNVWKSSSTILRVNNHLNRLAKKGQVMPLRQSKESLMVSVPRENAIYTLKLDKQGYITEIVRF